MEHVTALVALISAVTVAILFTNRDAIRATLERRDPEIPFPELRSMNIRRGLYTYVGVMTLFIALVVDMRYLCWMGLASPNSQACGELTEIANFICDLLSKVV